MCALFACFPLIHVGIGIAILTNPHFLHGKGGEPIPAFAGWLLIVIGGTIVLCGWALAAFICTTGRFLAHRRHYTFCLVIAAVECMFMPFGTILGVFTIFVLLRPAVKEMFAA